MLADEVAGAPLQRIQSYEAPPIVPDWPVDFDRVAHVSGGDRKTMREVLQAFDLQVDVLFARMASEEPRAAAARAHTMAVTARTIGAWKIEECATRFEQVALGPGPIVLSPIMCRLAAVVTEAQSRSAVFLKRPHQVRQSLFDIYCQA